MGEGGEKGATKKCRSYNISSFPCDKKLHIGEMHKPSLKSLVAHKVGLKFNPSISEQCLRLILLP
jgi:hypothetical protein